MNKTFEEMLDESYNDYNNIDESKLKIPALQLMNTSTKSYWSNILEFTNIINRDADHFLIFLKSELNINNINWYSADRKDGIVIHSKYIKKQTLMSNAKKYIEKYVICEYCKSVNTTCDKLSTKKYKFLCLQCNMTKTLI